jgi:hypothetical protein
MSPRRYVSSTVLALPFLALAATPGSAQTLDTSSVNQLAIGRVAMDDQCPIDADATPPAFASAQRTLTIHGQNFHNGTWPMVSIGLGPWVPASDLDAGGRWITVNVDCEDLSPDIYRLLVSTGQGAPYMDGIAVGLLLRGRDGQDGANGHDGAPGAKGDPGPSGAKGDKGDKGERGNHGQHGRSVRKQVIQPSDPQYANTGCQQGAAFVLVPQIFDEGTNTFIDDPNGIPSIVCHGKDGARGPAGRALGWHKRFTSVTIGATATTVLSQTATGSNSYMVDAKLNAPWANSQTQITCVLVAVENAVTTEIDRLDTQLFANGGQSTARGVIALAGGYTAAGGPPSNVTIKVNCWTRGDTRTVTHGRMNVAGVDTLVQQ